MSETNTENINSTNDTVINETEVVVENPTDADSEDVKKLKEQNAKLFARAKKAEGFTQQPDGSWIKKEKPVITNETVIVDSPNKSTYSRDELNLRLDGYTDDEVDFIMRNGGKKVLADANSIVAVAVKAKLEQRKAELAASKTSDSSGSSGVEVKYTKEQLSKMSVKELEAILPHAPQQ